MKPFTVACATPQDAANPKTGQMAELYEAIQKRDTATFDLAKRLGIQIGKILIEADIRTSSLTIDTGLATPLTAILSGIGQKAPDSSFTHEMLFAARRETGNLGGQHALIPASHAGAASTRTIYARSQMKNPKWHGDHSDAEMPELPEWHGLKAISIPIGHIAMGTALRDEIDQTKSIDGWTLNEILSMPSAKHAVDTFGNGRLCYALATNTDIPSKPFRTESLDGALRINDRVRQWENDRIILKSEHYLENRFGISALRWFDRNGHLALHRKLSDDPNRKISKSHGSPLPQYEPQDLTGMPLSWTGIIPDPANPATRQLLWLRKLPEILETEGAQEIMGMLKKGMALGIQPDQIRLSKRTEDYKSGFMGIIEYTVFHGNIKAAAELVTEMGTACGKPEHMHVLVRKPHTDDPGLELLFPYTAMMSCHPENGTWQLLFKSFTGTFPDLLTKPNPENGRTLACHMVAEMDELTNWKQTCDWIRENLDPSTLLVRDSSGKTGMDWLTVKLSEIGQLFSSGPFGAHQLECEHAINHLISVTITRHMDDLKPETEGGQNRAALCGSTESGSPSTVRGHPHRRQ